MKRIWNEIKKSTADFIKHASAKTILLYIIAFFAASVLIGTLLRYIYENVAALAGTGWHFRWKMIFENTPSSLTLSPRLGVAVKPMCSRGLK